MNDTRKSREKRLSIFSYVMPLVLAFIAVTSTYSVITGESLYDSGAELTTFGRITTAFFMVVFVGYATWAWRDLRRLRSEIEKDRTDGPAE